MNNGSDELSFRNDLLQTPLRVLLIITIVISAYGTGQAILSFFEMMQQPDMDVLLVTLWLLTAPLTFASAVFLFYARRQIMDGASATMPVTIGLGLMVLASVSNLISQVNILNGNGLSLVILCAIVLICYIILFLYYQKIGPTILAIFAGGMGVLCGGYYLLNGIVLVIDQNDQLLGYLFSSYLTAFMIAVSVLIFVLAVGYDDGATS